MIKEHPLHAIGRVGKSIASYIFEPMIHHSELMRKRNPEHFEKEVVGFGMEGVPAARLAIALIATLFIPEMLATFIPGSSEIFKSFAAGYLVFAGGDFVLATIYNLGYSLSKKE